MNTKILNVPASLVDAAESLKISNKPPMLNWLTEEQKHVIEIAKKQGMLKIAHSDNIVLDWVNVNKSWPICLSHIVTIDDDVEIVAVHERPEWLTIEPADEYRAQAGSKYLSSHLLAEYRKCPLMYYKKVNGLIADKDSTAYALGRAAHTLILEGREKFDMEYAVGGPINPKTGKPYGSATQAFAAWAEEVGKPVVSNDELVTLEMMLESVKSHETASRLLGQGWAEGVVRADYIYTPCQIRIDWFNPESGLVDLKTCDDLDKFECDALKFGYPYQLAFYRSVLYQASSHKYPCHIIAIEKKEPYRTGVWYMLPEVLTEAAASNAIAIDKLNKSILNNVWPTNYEDIKFFERLNFRN